MNANLTPRRRVESAREEFVAELANAAYSVALRRGFGKKWLDLELDLWKVLNETVNKWDRHALLPR